MPPKRRLVKGIPLTQALYSYSQSHIRSRLLSPPLRIRFEALHGTQLQRPSEHTSASVHKLLAQVAALRLDEGVQLGEKGDGPHEVAADDGEDQGGPPESVGKRSAPLVLWLL
jgi:hypothetical protein